MKRIFSCLLMSIVAVSLILAFSGCNGGMRSKNESMSYKTTQLEGGLVKYDIAYIVRNDNDKDITYRFPSGKQFDIWVICDGKEVFRESNGKVYTQSPTSFTLKPNETKIFNTSWTVDQRSLGDQNTVISVYAGLQSLKPIVCTFTNLLQ